MEKEIKRKIERTAPSPEPTKVDVSKEVIANTPKGDRVIPAASNAAKNLFVTTVRRPAAVAVRLINGRAIITANHRVTIIKMDTSKELIIALSVGSSVPEGVVSKEMARAMEAKEAKIQETLEKEAEQRAAKKKEADGQANDE